MFGQIDNILQQVFGLPYLYLSRDFNIHSRCRYLLYKLARLRGTGLSMLDVGCGAGITLRHLAAIKPPKIARYVGIDLAAERLRSRYRDIQDIDITFHDVNLDHDWDFGQFDIVWCSEVIEHLMDDAGQIAKMKHAAKPGGTVLITTPCLDFVQHIGALFPPILKTSQAQDGGHVRHGYRLEDMVRLAARAGLVVNSIDGVNRLTLAETEQRYTTRGLAWIANNIAKSWRTHGKIDFALGDDFKNQPERYASIGAELIRPKEMTAAVQAAETIACDLPATTDRRVAAITEG